MRVNALVDRQIASILTEQPPEPSDDYGEPAEYSPPVVEDSTCQPETVFPEERDTTPLVYSKKGKKKNKKMYS